MLKPPDKLARLIFRFLFIKSKLDGNGSNWLKSNKIINNVYLWTWVLT
jgi:hypothetical protein